MKKRPRIHPNACPKCGQLFKKVTGIWRCESCKINKKYDIDDGRPREAQKFEELAHAYYKKLLRS